MGRRWINRSFIYFLHFEYNKQQFNCLSSLFLTSHRKCSQQGRDVAKGTNSSGGRLTVAIGALEASTDRSDREGEQHIARR
jgi:hypothetical protein